jgi:hypothetical protein
MEGDNIMEKLIQEVNQCVANERERASAKFGPINHSDHESYAIILEEFQEAMEDTVSCHSAIERFWELTKDKSGTCANKVNSLRALRQKAILAACEFIQVAAMANKAILTTVHTEEKS